MSNKNEDVESHVSSGDLDILICRSDQDNINPSWWFCSYEKEKPIPCAICKSMLPEIHLHLYLNNSYRSPLESVCSEGCGIVVIGRVLSTRNRSELDDWNNSYKEIKLN